MKILGVRIDEVSKDDAMQTALAFLQSNKNNTIFTPNPEMIVDAYRDEYFKEVLNSGSLNICDGKGLELVSKGKLDRIAGVDFMIDICRLASEQGSSVYILGSPDKKMLNKAVEKLIKKFGKINIVGFGAGPEIKNIKKDGRTVIEVDEEENENIVHNIIMKAPDILFVGFGHGKQEKWIDENIKDLPSVRIAMGVGGSLDFISGNVKRAPRFLRKIGLEWLWRVMRQPSRIGRILKATVVFLYLYIFKNNDQ